MRAKKPLVKNNECGILHRVCGHGSAGRTSPCQGEGHGFKSHCPLSFLSWRRSQVVRHGSAKPLSVGSIPTVASPKHRASSQMPVFQKFPGAVAEQADAGDLKSSTRESVWVRFPPALPCVTQRLAISEPFCMLQRYSVAALTSTPAAGLTKT